jgi:hypothetical protein
MCLGGGGGGGGISAEDQINLQKVQMLQQQQLSDKQIAAQKDIATQQNTFNEQQVQAQKDLAAQQQAQADAQAGRQTEYDTGRASLLSQGSSDIDKAFSQFTPDYFNNFSSAYMAKIKDQVDQQKVEAQKQLAFGLARHGTLDSQANANQQGLMAETEGRTLADAANDATNQTNTLRSNVAQSKANLLGQVQTSESIGSPIAASDEGGVQAALQTQKNVISGVTNQAGDVSSSFTGVPTVSPLANIFSSVLGSAGAFNQGVNANAFGNAFNNAIAGKQVTPGANSPFL